MKRDSVRVAGRVSIPLGIGVRLSPGEQELVEERASTPERIGNALRRRRKMLGFTQTTAGEYCGHSARVIGEIERGKTTVQLGVVLDYAEFLGVEIRLKARD